MEIDFRNTVQGYRAMSIDESFFENFSELPPDRQRDVIDFAEFLHTKTASIEPIIILAGLWTDLNIDLSEHDITDARRECWSNFLREDV